MVNIDGNYGKCYAWSDSFASNLNTVKKAEVVKTMLRMVNVLIKNIGMLV